MRAFVLNFVVVSSVSFERVGVNVTGWQGSRNREAVRSPVTDLDPSAPLFLDEDLQKLAVAAARSAGMTPEEWLTQAILEKATANRSTSYPADDLGDQSSSRQMPNPPLPNPPLPNPPMENLLDAIRLLSDRVEQAERQTSSLIEPLSEQVSRLSEALEAVRKQDVISTAPLERAIARIGERLDTLEAPQKQAKK